MLNEKIKGTLREAIGLIGLLKNEERDAGAALFLALDTDAQTGMAAATNAANRVRGKLELADELLPLIQSALEDLESIEDPGVCQCVVDLAKQRMDEIGRLHAQ